MDAISGRPSETYSPLYFLTSLGSGGLVVTFFMWLMHWTRHPGRSVPVFEDIVAAFSAGGVASRTMIVLAVAGIAYYAFLNLKYLFWNLARFGLWKRTPAYAQLSSTNAETQILAMPLALAMIDVDNFKKFNDEHGHQVGDFVLREVCRVAATMLREDDLFARYGGEEFIVVLPGTDLEDGVIVAERIREGVRNIDFGVKGLIVTISGGVAQMKDETTAELVDRADKLLYRAKKKGRNRIES